MFAFLQFSKVKESLIRKQNTEFPIFKDFYSENHDSIFAFLQFSGVENMFEKNDISLHFYRFLQGKSCFCKSTCPWSLAMFRVNVVYCHTFHKRFQIVKPNSFCCYYYLVCFPPPKIDFGLFGKSMFLIHVT